MLIRKIASSKFLPSGSLHGTTVHSAAQWKRQLSISSNQSVNATRGPMEENVTPLSGIGESLFLSDSS